MPDKARIADRKPIYRPPMPLSGGIHGLCVPVEFSDERRKTRFEQTGVENFFNETGTSPRKQRDSLTLKKEKMERAMKFEVTALTLASAPILFIYLILNVISVADNQAGT